MLRLMDAWRPLARLMGNIISRIVLALKGRSGSPAAANSRSDALHEQVAQAIHGMTRMEHVTARLEEDMQSLKMLSGRIAAASMSVKPAGTSFKEVEFQVFSQFSDDGILQHLIHHTPIARREFIEFGVESYAEANTRFLLMKDNWRGLIMDGSEEFMNRVRNSGLHWRHDLTAKCAFVTPENINDLISQAGFGGDIGLLSVDVDGMDYWIWKAIHVVHPTIVVCEYNSVFGPDAAVTIPPDNSFQRTKAHHSNLFWGVSLRALEELALEKGYNLVGVNTAGNNAFFIRKDSASPFPPRSTRHVFVESMFRESRDRDGMLTFASGEERRKIIADCAVFDLHSGSVRKLNDVWKDAGKACT